MSEPRELRPEDLPALFGKPAPEPDQPEVEPEVDREEGDARQQDQPASPEQQHDALIAQLLGTKGRRDAEYFRRLLGGGDEAA